MKRITCVLAMLTMLTGLRAAPQLRSQSEPLAKELAGLLMRLKLEAVAAPDPEVPDRFVAAVLFQKDLLMVVAGRHASTAWIQDELKKKQFKDVYLDLFSGAVPDSKMFFQDLNADGLQPGGQGSADVMYERVNDQMIFDGDWTKHKMSEQTYADRFTQADEQYSGLLKLLITETKTKALANGSSAG